MPQKPLKDVWQHFCKGLILSTDSPTDAKRSVPLVASDNSSSGGSDSEEDDKTTSGPTNIFSTCVPGNKPDDLKRLVDYFATAKSFCWPVYGWSVYIWHITTTVTLMIDWTQFSQCLCLESFSYPDPSCECNYNPFFLTRSYPVWWHGGIFSYVSSFLI